jgi:OHCU decarboxylase
MHAGDLDRDAFVATFGGVYEASPWVAEAAWERRPVADVDALHAAMADVVARAPATLRRELIRAHPDLGDCVGGRSAESSREQVAAGLHRLTAEQRERLLALNAAYRERFGFPFVLCAREHSAESILAAAAERLASEPDAEERVALGEVDKIARLRLDDLARA